MSLINKMLQDLEQRQGAAAHSETMAGQMRSAPRVRKWRGAALGAAGMLALVCGAGAWVLMQTRGGLPLMGGGPVAMAAAPAVMAVAAPAVVPVAAPAVVAVAAPAAAPALSAAETQSPVHAVTVAMAVPKSPEAARDKLPEAATARPVAARPASSDKPAPGVKGTPASVQTDEFAGAERQQSGAQGSTQKSVNPRQASDNLYRQALGMVEQGRGGEARETLRKSLDANPRNVESLQLLVSLLVEGRNIDEALPLLREGLKLMPERSGLSMTLARLQVDRADAAGALATLERGLPSVRDDPEYHAFYAALLQRAGRHDEAVVQYLSALQSDPAMPNWLVGIGISLHAAGKDADAAEAFQRARDGGRLPSQLAEFVDQRLGQLRR